MLSSYGRYMVRRGLLRVRLGVSRLGITFDLSAVGVIALIVLDVHRAYWITGSALLLLMWAARRGSAEPSDDIRPPARVGGLGSRNERAQSVAASRRRRQRAAEAVRRSAADNRRPALTLLAELAGVASLLVAMFALVKEFL